MTALTITAQWDRKRRTFTPDHVFLEDCEEIADGTQVTLVVTTDRAPDQLKAYWATLGEIVKSGAWAGDKDSLDDYTRLGTGFGKWRLTKSGQSVFCADSIALSKCDGLKFNRFLWAAERLWAERLGVDIAELRRQSSGERISEAA